MGEMTATTSSTPASEGSSAKAIVETDVLIVGNGPAGASLACFLSSYGIKGIMISSAPTSANTPRAHITNMAALECLRDVGLDSHCDQAASTGHCMVHTRWCHSMAGEEYARIFSWGNDPMRKGDYESASPCSPSDLPQTLLEPILVRYALLHGYQCRFDTSFVSFVDEGETVLTTLQDKVTGIDYQVRSKYLFGADGARSRIMKQLNLPLCAKPGSGVAINVLVQADLSRLVEHRQGNLHWVMQPDREHCGFAWMGIVRMVRPWNEWMFILFPKPGYNGPEPTQDDYLKQVKNFIGDDSIATKILDISKWTINEIFAEQYSSGNVFCLGDAVHRHPPFNGLGSNTCIQDAFNLAWKIAYVLRNQASPSLLSTYSTERQPVGQGIVTRANDGFREHFRVWESIGILPEDLESRKAILRELSAPTAEGQRRRTEFQNAIMQTSHEFHALGIEMGQRYTGSGIYTEDEAPYQPLGRAAVDPVLFYSPNTYPGCRLPHAWLNKAIPEKPISTIDLAGNGCFTLITGIGGEVWKSAAPIVEQQLGIPLRVYTIGFRQDWEDVYFDWSRLRGVEESGAVLIRPDRFVAWRSVKALDNETECARKLLHVMSSILGRKGE